MIPLKMNKSEPQQQRGDETMTRTQLKRKLISDTLINQGFKKSDIGLLYARNKFKVDVRGNNIKIYIHHFGGVAGYCKIKSVPIAKINIEKLQSYITYLLTK